MADADTFVKDAINNQIARIEAQISLLQSHSKEASPGSISSEMMKREMESLRDMVSFLRRPSSYGNQSDNSTYYGLPEKLPDGSSARSKEASLDAHTKLAKSVLGTLGQTEAKIDQLVLAGKKFDVAKAKGELYRVAKNVDIIVKHPKFKEAGQDVGTALTELSKRANHIHGLFAPAKV